MTDMTKARHVSNQAKLSSLARNRWNARQQSLKNKRSETVVDEGGSYRRFFSIAQSRHQSSIHVDTGKPSKKASK